MELIELTATQTHLLAPLMKWRVMDINSAIALNPFKVNYTSFCRMVRCLEGRGVLGSYRRPAGGKKYIYPTPLGDKLLGSQDTPTTIAKETLLHDIATSDLVRGLLAEGWFESAALEHELHNKREFGSAGRVVPDAILEGLKDNKRFRIALEVELTSKSHKRSEEKMRGYLSQRYFDYFLYAFPKASQQACFQRLVSERFGEEAMNRLMCFSWDWQSALPSAQGSFKGRCLTLKEIFS